MTLEPRYSDVPILNRIDIEANTQRQVVPKNSATFGLPRENIVQLNAGHSDMCRFDATDQRDKDNLEIVLNNLDDQYEKALESCESAMHVHLPELNTGTSDKDLEDRMAALNSVK